MPLLMRLWMVTSIARMFTLRAQKQTDTTGSAGASHYVHHPLPLFTQPMDNRRPPMLSDGPSCAGPAELFHTAAKTDTGTPYTLAGTPGSLPLLLLRTCQ